MKVNDLIKMLEDYNGDADVIFVEWDTGRTYDITVGSDDDDEGTKYCSLGKA